MHWPGATRVQDAGVRLARAQERQTWDGILQRTYGGALCLSGQNQAGPLGKGIEMVNHGGGAPPGASRSVCVTVFSAVGDGGTPLTRPGLAVSAP
jgi:hypothetical protein